jgi:hypothetical protein
VLISGPHSGTWTNGWIIRRGSSTATCRRRLNFRHDPSWLYGSAPGTRRPRHRHASRRPSGAQIVFVDLQSNVCFNSTSHPQNIMSDSTEQQERSHTRGEKEVPTPEPGVSRRSTPLLILHGRTRVTPVHSKDYIYTPRPVYIPDLGVFSPDTLRPHLHHF